MRFMVKRNKWFELEAKFTSKKRLLFLLLYFGIFN